jgi:hypothetical protein
MRTLMPRHQFIPGTLLVGVRDLQLALYDLWDAHPFGRFVEWSARRLSDLLAREGAR